MDVVFFRKADGEVTVTEWLHKLAAKDRRKCLARIERLGEHGHELSRPYAAYLRDGVYELRVKSGTVNFRMLYFFSGRTVVVISHGVVKKTEKVPSAEIDRAVEAKREFGRDPGLHSFRWER